MDVFSVIQIETQNTCSRKCWFCKFGQERQDTSIYNLSTPAIEKIAAELSALDYQGRIFPCAINEPLLDDRIVKIIRLFREACPKAFISVNTNGDKLSESLLKELFEAGLDALGYSVYTKEAQLKARTLSQSYKRLVILDRLNQTTFENRGGNIKEGLQEFHPELELVNTCGRPFSMMTVKASGKVALCCADLYGDVVMGDVYSQGLLDIWKGEKFTRYREVLSSSGRNGLRLCDVCSYGGASPKLRYPLEQNKRGGDKALLHIT